MAETKTTLKEMRNGDVRYISLVRRAANRIPIKITKSDKEDTMIDLSNLRRVLKGEQKPEAPSIAAVVLAAEPGEAVKAKLSELGLGELAHITKNEDGTVVLSKDGNTKVEAKIVRLSEDVALVVKGLQLWSSGLDSSTDFNEVLAANSFYSGLSTATCSLGDTIRNICYSATDPGAAASSIGEAVKKFETYATTLVGNIPTVAWKMEQEIAAAIKADAEAATAASTATKSEEAHTGDAGKADAANTQATTESTAAAVKAEGTETAGVATGAAPAADAAKPDAQPDLAASIAAALKAEFAPQFEAVNTAIKGVQEQFTKLEGEVREVATKAEGAQKAVKATVVAAAAPTDTPAADGDGASGQSVAKKGEVDFYSGRDSAFA
ncbi:hypothetical protein WK13_34835 [Burkholderia ubonensis]|uniref:hypothetical protein n=1 Tax=Burkholderia ubonensis TaxID=101571 RepID=UPI000759EBD2|nr:hypothetical protein [Burkholderia ubonensis]KVR21717.1 hypothetical protein WK13_34835 [Burkholderia ubonensis]